MYICLYVLFLDLYFLHFYKNVYMFSVYIYVHVYMQKIDACFIYIYACFLYICNDFFIEYDVFFIDDHIYDVCTNVDEI